MFINVWISTCGISYVHKLKVIRSYKHSYPHVLLITFLITFKSKEYLELSGYERNVFYDEMRNNGGYDIYGGS